MVYSNKTKKTRPRKKGLTRSKKNRSISRTLSSRSKSKSKSRSKSKNNRYKHGYNFSKVKKHDLLNVKPLLMRLTTDVGIINFIHKNKIKHKQFEKYFNEFNNEKQRLLNIHGKNRILNVIHHLLYSFQEKKTHKGGAPVRERVQQDEPHKVFLANLKTRISNTPVIYEINEYIQVKSGNTLNLGKLCLLFVLYSYYDYNLYDLFTNSLHHGISFLIIMLAYVALYSLSEFMQDHTRTAMVTINYVADDNKKIEKYDIKGSCFRIISILRERIHKSEYRNNQQENN